MIIFLIIVTVGLIYAACVFDADLFWFLGVATIVQIFYNLFWKEKPGSSLSKDQTQSVLDRFFADMKHSPWSTHFSRDAAKEKIETLNEVILKALYQSIQNELKEENDETYYKNLTFVRNDIREEIADRQIEAYQHAARKHKRNYARIYADSLKAPLCSQSLNDAEALKTAAEYSDAELVFVVLDTPQQISDTTAELTTGREEDMERYYHNNLRRIAFLLRLELARRFLEA